MDESQQDLWERFIRNECTSAEIEQLLAQFNDAANEADLRGLIGKALRQEVTRIDPALPDLDQKEAALYTALLPQIQEERKVSVWPRIAAVASIVLFLGVGSYFVWHSKLVKQQLVQNDITPFSKQAILKTGHGKVLQLDSTQKGLLARYANTKIHTSGYALRYSNNTTAESVAIFDTLQVPAGGKPYYLQLADGSQVIVNVASALRFPENFRKKNNEVQLIAGEAYFAIAHNAAAPLLIKAKDQIIEDIGTEFNVNTYDDEGGSRTTLVEGAVRVNHKNLVPGQQAIITSTGLTIAKADVEQVISWKNGYFRFNGEDIQTIMRQLARWYNIEVQYQGRPSKEGYYVKISRSMNISQVLRVLELTNSVHFKIEGRRVLVLHK
ncbi:MAG TPA: FecR domain-containing protein [Mucilaginibacter sp.]